MPFSLGYDPGPPYGLKEPRTRGAIPRYQANDDAQVTGEPSRYLQDMLTGTP